LPISLPKWRMTSKRVPGNWFGPMMCRLKWFARWVTKLLFKKMKKELVRISKAIVAMIATASKTVGVI
jgi:hypothetical protein